MSYEVDFLPVGGGEKSGDAIAIRFGNFDGGRDEQTVIVIDSGFKESGEKLVEFVKEHYKTDKVDLAISSHSDDDHCSGLEVVLENLTVGCLWMHRPWKHTEDMAQLFEDNRVTDNSVSRALKESLQSARTLEKIATDKGVTIVEPFRGVIGAGGHLRVLGPTKAYYESLLPQFRGMPELREERGMLAQAVESAKEAINWLAETFDIETLDGSGETSAENNSSTVLLLSVDGEELLFTSDAGIPALTQVTDHLQGLFFDFSSLRFIQVPHHGSQRNISPDLLDILIGPKITTDQVKKIAFVSVAKDDNGKHPSKKVMNAFRRRGAPVHATQGSIKSHRKNSPHREGWVASVALPFYSKVEE